MRSLSTMAQGNAPAVTVKSLCSQPAMAKRFSDVLGKRAPQFLASVISTTNSSKALRECEPMSVMGSAMMAATLDLPVVPAFGQAYIVPFRDHGVMKAQFQIGYKGLIQLAQRSGQYSKMSMGEIYKDEYDGYDWVQDEVHYHEVEGGMRTTHRNDPQYIAGFFAYFKMVSGFEKMVFWSMDEVKDHAKTYSESYRRGHGPWVDHFIEMARKTVLKNTLSHWGVLSVAMQNAILSDQAVVEDVNGGETLEYPDNVEDEEEEQPQEAEQAPVTEAVADDAGAMTL